MATDYELAPLPPVYPRGSDIVPFTVTWGGGLMGLFEQMRVWLDKTLVPYINANMEGLSADWVAQSALLIEKVELIASSIGDSVEQAKDAKEAAEAAAALAAQFASTVEAFQDLSISSILGEDESKTRLALDALYATSGEVANLDSTIAALTDNVEKKLFGKVTPEMFGAIGNEIADDTAALQAMFNYLATHGGIGTSSGRYRVTNSINVFTPAYAAQYDGLNSTELIADFATSVNLFNGRNLSKWKLANFTVTSVGVEKIAHGIAMANCSDSIVDNVKVKKYSLSAAMFYVNTSFPGNSERNVIRDSVAHGEGFGRNGFFHESSVGSLIQECHVFDLSSTEGPGYGLQLKNNSVNCSIIGGSVTNAVAGVAFGYEMVDSWATGCTVSGVVIKDCVHGVLGSRVTNSTIDVIIDMANARCLTGIRLAGNAIKNYVNARISSVGAGQVVVYAQDSDNVIDVPLINGFVNGTLLELGANAGNNYITYGRIVGISIVSIPTQPLPVLGTNVVVYDSETAWTNIPLSGTWAAALGRTPQVKRVGNMVFMRGQASGGGDGNVGTIPGGFRPKDQTIVLPSVLSTASLSITTGGSITVSSAGIAAGAVLNHSWPIF